MAKMANTTFFVFILFLSLAASTMSLESFGQAQDHTLQQKTGNIVKSILKIFVSKLFQTTFKLKITN